LRHGAEDPLYEVTVWIDERETATSDKILSGHGLDEGRLPGAGFADDVEVKEPVCLLDAEYTAIVTGVRATDVRDVAVHLIMLAPAANGDMQ
jgi:hypothetical protein